MRRRLDRSSLAGWAGAMAALGAALALLPGCASAPAGTGPAAAASRPAAPSGPGAQAARPPQAASGPMVQPPAPGQPPPFAQVIAGTKKIDGLFGAWQKDEKVWLELQPTDFDKPFFLSPKVINGIGEAGLYGGAMLSSPRLVKFRRLYNVVQLVALNPWLVARDGTPEARAVEAAASLSLLAATPVASLPHPDRRSVLVDAGNLFVGEMLGIGAHLQRTYRQGYGLDGRNSAITAVRGKPDLTVIEVLQHYATGQIQVPTPGGPPGAPLPTTPGGLPDARSMFIKLHYSLARLPEQPMARRLADPRIGHFTQISDDFSDDLARSPRQRVVDRWRLEKKPVLVATAPTPAASAPAAAASAPMAAASAPVAAAAGMPAAPASSPAVAAGAAADAVAVAAHAPVVAASAAMAASAPLPAASAAVIVAAAAPAPASAPVDDGLVEPVKPITYWLDRNVPLKYRQAITDGVLEWNKAFERLGFRNAIVVKQQPDDADFDTADVGVASIRWLSSHVPGFVAIGPSHVDPRSGEILDADIGIEGLPLRGIRSLRAGVLGGRPGGTSLGSGMSGAAGMPTGVTPADEWARLLQVSGAPAGSGAELQCHHADEAAEQLGYALDLLAARDELDPDGPEAQAFVLAYLKDATMHEVGHTLGLRHNFRASIEVHTAQLDDADYTRSHPLAGSVMDYPAINLPAPGSRAAPAAFSTTLGPYDYWAIEYAYKPIAPADEKAELARIAARSAEPGLAYGSDEDNFLGIDPEALWFDLGDDPLAFATRRFDIAGELYQRQASRELKPDADYATLRRGLNYALRDAARAAGVVLRQIGGVRTLRDFPGTGRDPLRPVPAARQRAALALLSGRLLSADAFTVPAALQRRLAPDFLERLDGASSTEYLPAQELLELQRALLNRLMSDALAVRLLDSAAKLDRPADAYRPAELYARLEADIWGELARPGLHRIAAPRRDLQREHVARLAFLVLRPNLVSRADARMLLRQQATALAARLEQAARRAGLDDDTRLHLKDSAESLRTALAAKMERLGA